MMLTGGFVEGVPRVDAGVGKAVAKGAAAPSTGAALMGEVAGAVLAAEGNCPKALVVPKIGVVELGLELPKRGAAPKGGAT
jgi:hypothetical protein